MKTITGKLAIKLLLLPFILLAGCLCDPPEGNYTHFYTETQCADPWASLTDSLGLEGAVTSYLADSGIHVLDFQVTMDSSQISFCQACFCGTGRTIDITVSGNDGARLEDLVLPEYNQWTSY